MKAQEHENPIKKLIKSIMKMIRSLFRQSGTQAEVDHAMKKLAENVKDSLSHDKDKSDLRNWANQNGAEFLDKIRGFIQENKTQLSDLCDKGKYSEIYDMVAEGIAKDIEVMQDFNSLPDDISSDPTRRDHDVIEESFDDVRNVFDDLELDGAETLYEQWEGMMADQLSSPPKSAYEKDTGKSYDQKVEPKIPEQEQEYGNEQDLER